MELKKLLSEINIDADWIGLREVREKGTYRVIRDGNPQANGAGTSHGIMVEVLAKGQFGYYATNDMSLSGVQNAAAKAKDQAIRASKYSLYSFSKDVRPKATGSYESSFSKAASSVSAGEINEILLAGCDALKVSDKIVSASAYGLITETEFNLYMIKPSG